MDTDSGPYGEFRIRVKNTRELIALRAGKPSLTDGEVHLGGLARETVDVLSRWLAEGKITRRDELVLLGAQLYRVLFRDEVHHLFMKAYREARRNSKQPLRVVLEFTPEAKDLAVWPWEYLYRPDGLDEGGKGFFIAARNNLILSRHVPMTLPDEVWSDEEEVRILAVVSSPKGRTKVKSQPVLDMLAALAHEAADPPPPKVRLETLEQPTKRKFEDQLSEFRPHIVHFIGHGKYADGAGELGFVDEESGEATWIKDQTVADCFEECNTRLVFLQACEGARSDSYDAFSGVALQLAYSRVPAVIAMRYEVANKVAVAFAQKFYGALREGRAIDEAVQMGRRELGKYLEEERNFSSRAFGCPVVYLQSVDMEERGVIRFPRLQLVSEVDRATPEQGKVYLCPRPGCNTPINPERKFCPNADCRTEFRICPDCGEAYMAKSGFCDNCGWPHHRALAADQEPASPPPAERLERRPLPRSPDHALPPAPAASRKAPAGEPEDKPPGAFKLWQRR